MQDCIQILGGRSIYQAKVKQAVRIYNFVTSTSSRLNRDKVHYRALFDKKTALCQAIDMTVYCDTGCANNDAGFNGFLYAIHADGPYGVPNFQSGFDITLS